MARNKKRTMARVNIDIDLFTTSAWIDLVVLLGDREKALGALNWAWIIAQKFYVPERMPIPKDVWKMERLNDALITVGFALDKGDGYHLRGSEDQFAWLFQKHEAGAKGGRPKKIDDGGASDDLDSVDEPEETGRLSGDNREESDGSEEERIEPSSSCSLSSSPSGSLDQTNTDDRGGESHDNSTRDRRQVKGRPPAPVSEFDLRQVVMKYPPRNENPRVEAGLRELESQIKTETDFKDCILAAENYFEHCRNEGILGTRYVMQFKTWAGAPDARGVRGVPEWRAWIHRKPKSKQSESTQRTASRDDELKGALDELVSTGITCEKCCLGGFLEALPIGVEHAQLKMFICDCPAGILFGQLSTSKHMASWSPDKLEFFEPQILDPKLPASSELRDRVSKLNIPGLTQ